MSSSSAAAADEETRRRKAEAEGFKEKFKKGEQIDDDLELTEEIIGKLGIHPSDAGEVFRRLWENKKKTWGNLLALEGKEEAIEVVDGDKGSGATLWNAVQEYKKRAAELRQETVLRASFNGLQTGGARGIPTFVSDSVESVCRERMRFVEHPEFNRALENVLKALRSSPTSQARTLSIPGFEGPMGVGKTRTGLEVCCRAADDWAKSGKPRPLVLYHRLRADHWSPEISRKTKSSVILAQAIVFANPQTSPLDYPNLTFEAVQSALKRDGYSQVLLHIDECQLNRKVARCVLSECLKTMTSPRFGVVVIPVFTGISLPARKVLPSDPICDRVTLRAFSKDELLEPFCERIKVTPDLVNNSVNLRLLFDLCAGSPHIVDVMTENILRKCDDSHFLDELQQNNSLTGEQARIVFEDTLSELHTVYGDIRWHELVRGNRPEPHMLRIRQSWKEVTITVIKWVFCQGFLGDKVANPRHRVGTLKQADKNFPTYADCIQAGLFGLDQDGRLQMPLLGLMVLDKIVSILPPGINDPFSSNWGTLEFIGAASFFLRLKLAQFKGKTSIPLSELRPGCQSNGISAIKVKIPDDLRFVYLGAKATGKPGDVINRGIDGLGNPVAFRSGLVALTKEGEEAIDAVFLFDGFSESWRRTTNVTLFFLSQTKARDQNIGNGAASERVLYNAQIEKLFANMEAVGSRYLTQFQLDPKRTKFVFDFFSNRFEPADPKSGFASAKGKSYCITREESVVKVAGPTFARLANKRLKLDNS